MPDGSVVMRYPAFWQRRGLTAWLLWPLGALVCREAERRLRRARPRRLKCPVVVVGNVTVGGTGKTPVVIALVEALREAGWQPGVVSRGFGVKLGIEPLDLAEADGATTCGDEPWLIRQRTGAPVVVHPRRRQAAEQLLARYPEVDVIVSDDGLQHHRLPRDVEWVIVDGKRGLGNGFCLPAGPLREHPDRLGSVDAVLINGPSGTTGLPADEGGNPETYRIDFALEGFRDLFDDSECPPDALRGERVTAIAGIGNPSRFFDMLLASGIQVDAVPLDDHAAPEAEMVGRLLHKGRTIVITEKDAVKWPMPPDRPGQVLVARGGIALPRTLLDRAIAGLDARRKNQPTTR
ncbi:tetraacyldisaccharide 4'-kinase [Guyparkeria sp.]|uniref:tetraacyldisaccharide 4'-kinase n=1 Tax=Guyparkeria sp. TaxID=2035736 RepID=UPI003970C107